MSSTVTASARQYTRANTEYFSIPNASAGAFHLGDNDFTIATWAKIDSKVGVQSILANYLTTGNQRSLSMDYYNTSDRFRIVLSSDGTNVTIVSANNLGIPSLATNYFVVATYNHTTDALTISANDGTADTGTHASGMYATTADFTVGSSSAGTNPWSGSLSTTAMWNRVLTGTEITSLYNSGTGKLFKDITAGEASGLIAWYDGAETSGVLLDASGNARNMTDNNTVTSAAGKVTYTAEDASQFTAANSEFLSRADASLVGLDFNGNVDMYLAAWVYIDAVGADRPIIGKWSASTGNRQYLLSYFTGTTQFGFFVSNDGAATVTNYASTFGTVPTGTWLFVQAYHDATNDLIGISVNNGAYNTAAHSTGIFNSAASFDVGRYRNGSGTFLYMDGRLASCIATSGIPTADEQTALYQRGFGRDYSDLPALSVATYVSVWELTEASGTRVDSVTASANDLTDNNSVTGNPGVVYDAPAAPVGGAFLQSRPISLRIGLGL